MTKYDVSIEEVTKVETKGLQYSYLTVKFSGKSVNVVLINTLRRVLFDNIPTHAFPLECITVEKNKNSSVFNNDYMRLRLTQLPIINTKLDLSYLPAKYWHNIDFSKEREFHPQEKRIEIYINSTNTTDTVYDVTTSDIKYYEDGELVHNKYNQEFPIVLIELRPTEIFSCHMTSALGTGEKNAIWSCVSNVFYKIDGDDIVMTLESNGQFNEYELLWKATRFMHEKMEELKETISQQKQLTKIKEVELILDNETYTIGGILTDILQNMDVVIYAGVTKPNQLVKSIMLRIEYNKELDDPYKPIYEAIQYIIGLMNHMEKQIYKIGEKYLTIDKKEESKKEKKTESKKEVKKSSKKTTK